MTPLPIAFCLFTSTKGHWGRTDLYKVTLDDYNRQVPLDLFGSRLAHIKVGEQEQALGDEMEANLKARGFDVIKTVADWSRGTAHQHGILQDQRTLSSDPRFHAQPYMLLVEDDSIVRSHDLPLADLLGQACRMLAENHELVSVRTLRREDINTSLTLVPPVPDKRWFYSPHYNLQPSVLRTRDFYIGCNLIQANWAQLGHLQCELVWRIVMAQLSRSECRHLVYHPDYCETVHLGVEHNAALIASLNL